MNLYLPPIAGNVQSIAVENKISSAVISNDAILIIDPCVVPFLDKNLLSKFKEIIRVEGGEQAKTEERFRLILLQNQNIFDGLNCIVAIGGGSTLNIATFIAHEMASHGRSFTYHIAPTTLMAMVDVAYGSLGRLNQNGVKNRLRGAFDPTSIILDPIFLEHLPVAEMKRGLTECLKHALLQSEPDNAGIFPTIEECLTLFRKNNPPVSSVFALAKKTLNAKAAVIESIRKGNAVIENILSYGHVDAEPREAASGLHLSHGDAVLLGLAIELQLCGPAKANEMIIDVIPHTPLKDALAWIDFDADTMRASYRLSSKPRFNLGNDHYRVIHLSRLGQFSAPDRNTKVDLGEFEFDALFDAGRRIIRRALEPV